MRVDRRANSPVQISKKSMSKGWKEVSDHIRLFDRPSLLLDKYLRLFLPAILLLALIIRVLALLSLRNSIYFDYLLWDERVYHTWAVQIAKGTFQSSSVFEMAPFPAYLMAFVYKILSPDILYIRLLNIILGVLTCYLVYLTGKELVNQKTGILACLVACLYKPFIFYSIVPLKTSLSVVLFALSVSARAGLSTIAERLVFIRYESFFIKSSSPRPISLVVCSFCGT